MHVALWARVVACGSAYSARQKNLLKLPLNKTIFLNLIEIFLFIYGILMKNMESIDQKCQAVTKFLYTNLARPPTAHI